MKRIIVCITIAVISLVTAITSFAINDYHRYRSWIKNGGPYMMRPFGGKDWEEHHRNMMGDFRGPRGDRWNEKCWDDEKEKTFDKEERNRDRSPASNFSIETPSPEKTSLDKGENP